MNHKKIKQTAFILLFFFLCNVCILAMATPLVELTDEQMRYLEETGPITMVVDPDWMPYELVDEEGNFTGIAADLVRLVEERLPLTFEIIPTKDWSETLQFSREGRALVIPFLNQTPAREEWLIFTDPLFIDPNVVVTRQDFQFISDLGQLTDRSIVLPEGTSIEERVRHDFPNLRIITTPNETEVFRMVNEQEADMTIRSLAVAAYTIRKEGFFNLKVNTQIPEYTNFLRMGVLKSEPILVDILNQGIATITPFEREQIFTSHVNIVVEEVVDYTFLRQIMAVSGLLLLFLLLWNHRQGKINRELQRIKSELQDHKDRHDILAKQSSSFIWEVDKNGLHTYISDSIYDVLGYTPEEVIGRLYFYDFLPEDQYEQMKEYGMGFVEQGEPFKELEVVQLHKNGTIVHMISSGMPIFDPEGNVRGYRGIDTDMTDRIKMQTELIKSEQQYRLLFENAVEGIVVLQDGMIKMANPMASEITGYSNQELTDKSIMELVHPDDQQKVMNLHKERVAGRKNKVKETYKIIRKDKQEIWMESHGISITWNDRPASISFITDITEQKKKDEEILYLSFYDQMTGIYNRRFFEEELKRLDNPRNLPLTLVLIDVNGLKLFNDGFGHQTGDLLLKAVADILKTEARANDIVARVGGDEFVVLMPDTNQEQSCAFLKRVMEKMKQTKVADFSISFSLGYETKTLPEEDIEVVFKKAEEYMYQRKVKESAEYREMMVDQITEALFVRNRFEKAHAHNVAGLMVKFAEFFDYSQEKTEEMRLAGFYHDIGKTTISNQILLKTSSLNEEEKKEISRHPEIGYQILKSSNKYLSVANTVLYHHERWDGNGYAKKLKKKEIPYESRMLAIAEAYDELTGIRAYKKAMSPEDALVIIRAAGGTHFDPELAEIFVDQIMTEKEA